MDIEYSESGMRWAAYIVGRPLGVDRKALTMSTLGVQSFYERMPYPAPLTNLDKHVEVFKNPEQRRIRSLLMFPEGASKSSQHILVAGCGTSQAARVALREPDSRVVAIDISAASLDHLRALQ